MGHQNRELRKELEKIIPPETTPVRRPAILGLVFLRYICAAAEEYDAKNAFPPQRKADAPEGGNNSDPAAEASGQATDRSQATDRNRSPERFFVPDCVRWDRIFPRNDPAGESTGGNAGAGKDTGENAGELREIAGAIRAVERENPLLRGLFPDVLKYPPGRSSRPPEDGSLFPAELGRFLEDLCAREAAWTFKYLWERFEKTSGPDPLENLRASTARRGRSGKTGETPIPHCVAELLAHMLEPYQGRFYDPCCRSAAFLTGAADFVTSRQGKLPDISFYAQERSLEAWRFAGMNLIVRDIDTTDILLNPDSPLQRDRFRDLKFDFITACPSFGENPYSWIQYVLDRLSPVGLGAIVLSRGSLSSFREGDREIRRTLVDGRLLDCVVNLPPRIIGALNPCLWFLSRAKAGRGRRADELLFIDARQLGRSRDRRHWEFSGEDISRIARTYHNWRFPKAAPYRDLRQFAVSISLSQIREEQYNLNPAFYLGIPETGEDTGQEVRFAALRAEFEELVREDSRLSRQLVENLRKIRFED
ncbi:MAG: SAM-dependent methyltransferase [Treponema sp.]|jgi:type I restriction enzyme M protein|nr:SAM-dependent methyltransferase [Treponema sp.]